MNVNIQIVAKIGAVSVELSSGENDILHHIGASAFAQKILELADYFGPADEPPLLPPLLSSHSPKQTSNTAYDPRSIVDEEIEKVETVGQIKDDKTLREFLDKDVP